MDFVHELCASLFVSVDVEWLTVAPHKVKQKSRNRPRSVWCELVDDHYGNKPISLRKASL